MINWFHQVYYQLGHEQKGTWNQTFWMGVRTEKLPLDMWIYQEILHGVRPDFILETGTRHGGARFLCQMMDLICGAAAAGGADGAARTASACEVVTVDVTMPATPPQHPRLTYLTGSSTDPRIIEEVRIAPRARNRCWSCSIPSIAATTSSRRCAYHDLVTPGSYMIVEDSNMNGHPVWPTYGPGPMEAIQMFLQENQDFAIDKQAEKFLFTFNPYGYLWKKRKE